MGRVELPWNPFDPTDPGPCIEVLITNTRQIMKAGREIGFEYPKPVSIRALLDTGASVTVISKVFAEHCKLFQTGEDTEITAIGSPHRCGEHAGAISFPNTSLRPLEINRIISVKFMREPHYACLIGRDILRNWTVVFDGKAHRVTITD